MHHREIRAPSTAGANGKIQFSLVDAKNVLAVPSTALQTGRSGDTVIRTVDGREIAVVVGQSASGYTEISAAELKPGIEVELP